MSTSVAETSSFSCREYNDSDFDVKEFCVWEI